MQPSIWRKEFLLITLLSTFSPWDFELKGTELLKNKESNIFIDKLVKNVYFHGVGKGFKKSSE